MGVTKLLVATANRHKVDEIRCVLGGDYEVGSMQEVMDPPNLVEDEHTFSGNASAKATQLARHLLALPQSLPGGPGSVGIWVLADDSGLEVDALGGAPGVHSARFAHLGGVGSGNATDQDNNAKLLGLLGSTPQERRTARFRCALALVQLEWAREGREARLGVPVAFEGVCEGHIALEPRGAGGFGYDPLFIPEGESRTFGELGEETKNRLSHRYRALVQMRDWLGLRLHGGNA